MKHHKGNTWKLFKIKNKNHLDYNLSYLSLVVTNCSTLHERWVDGGMSLSTKLPYRTALGDNTKEIERFFFACLPKNRNNITEQKYLSNLVEH